MTNLSEWFVGSWRLVFFAEYEADGREIMVYGPTPRGSLIYDRGGRMSVHITHSERQRFVSDDAFRGSPEEITEAFHGYFGYFGRYTVDEFARTVTHHIAGASHPNIVGTDQRRFFTMQGERLILSTQPERATGADMKYVATWEREP